MTMDFSILELVLMVWAVVATSQWMEARADARSTRNILRIFIEDANAREQMLSKFEEFKKKVGA